MKKVLTLRRNFSNKFGTFGELLDGEKHLCFTLEEPWRDNANGISCIPSGLYQVVRHGWEGEKVQKPFTWRLLHVPGRSGILIHVGNTLKDTEGCILVGLKYKEDYGLLQSQKAMDMLRETLPESFDLMVMDI